MVKKVEGQGNSNGSYYVIEAHFADKDIGFLEPGIQAKIKVNAYRSNKFGMLNGALGELRFQQSGSQPAGSFVTYIVPNAGYLLYDEKRWELKEGMSVVVDVKVGERNIIDYLLSSIKNKQSEVMREI
jgi:multidrug efflux pump subunit AcrA (membrane-fusion protein)